MKDIHLRYDEARHPRDAVSEHYDAIGTTPLLTSDEERALAQRIGDAEQTITDLLVMTGLLHADPVDIPPAHDADAVALSDDASEAYSESAVNDREKRRLALLALQRYTDSLTRALEEIAQCEKPAEVSFSDIRATLADVPNRAGQNSCPDDRDPPSLRAIDEKALRAQRAIDEIEVQAGIAASELIGIGRTVERCEITSARAKSELVKGYLPLVVAIAEKHRCRGVPYSTLIQGGNLALIRATERFDYRQGHCFSTYAAWWIRQWILRAVVERSRTAPTDEEPMPLLDIVADENTASPQDAA